MRDDYPKFAAQNAEIVAVAPSDAASAAAYAAKNALTFPIASDTSHQVFDAYDVASARVSLGQRPGLFVLDEAGAVRFAYVGAQQWQIPSNADVLAMLEKLPRAAR